jgi:hypothetical protein
MSKKSAALSSELVAVKGKAAPANDMPVRGGKVKVSKLTGTGAAPLNFRVSAAFRRDFKTYAAAHDLKLNELLVRSFEAYKAQNQK